MAVSVAPDYRFPISGFTVSGFPEQRFHRSRIFRESMYMDYLMGKTENQFAKDTVYRFMKSI
ncbi:MAG: hypothetical protein LUI14_04260, partial [Lachnospiraceae bacterium]|nr:hypothetical protein [Lachnospiraceae bacterium]